MRPWRALLALRPALLGVVALLSGSDAHLGGPPSAPPPPSPLLPLPLQVEHAGCGAVLDGPVCELPEDGALRLWVKEPEGAHLAAAIDGEPIPLEGAPVQGGLRVPIRIPAHARELTVTAARDEQRAVFRLPLRPPRPPDASLTDAEALRKQGKLDEASAHLAALLSDPDPARRARALGKLARIERTRGRAAEAVARFEESIGAHRASGQISEVFLDAFTLSFTLLYNGRRFAEARRALDRLDPLVPIHPEGGVLRTYYAALLSYEAGDLRATLELLRASAEGAERLGLERHRLDVLQIQADVLQALGRGAEGERILREVSEAMPADADPCRRASLLASVGWFAVQALSRDDRSEPRAEDAIAPLTQAVALYRGSCPDVERRANALTNLALASLTGGDVAGARRHLAEARRERPDPDPRITAWLLDIEGRIALRGGAPARALPIYERMADLAAISVLPGSRVRAALGRGEALEALGRAAGAREAYAQAEALLDDRSLLVPLGEGRETFVGQFEEGARRRVDLLLRHDPAQAADAARRSRARALAALGWRERLESLTPADRARWEGALSDYRRAREALDLEARGDWRLAADAFARTRERRRAVEAQLQAALDQALAVLGRAGAGSAEGGALPPLDDGELLLVFHPILAGWAGFALTREGVTARRLPQGTATASPANLARRLLAPFRDRIAAARRIRLAPYGELDRIDFHALPWNGAPLLTHAPVAYAVDLPGRAPRPSTPDQDPAPWALVVADPRRDLPAARREAEAIAGALERAGGWSVQRLWAEQATHPAVRGGLERPGARLFHYAGHGFFGGRDGWESGLPLAAGGWLTVRDVLALPRAPAHVVLSGCDTARTAPEARSTGLGLAQAFVVAGAASVIAATRPLDDRLAERLMAALYASGSGLRDPAAALREAALAVHSENPASDWASLRVLVP